MMMLEEDYGPDRVIKIETDDEDNEAENCHNHDDDTESDTGPSRNLSSNFIDADHPSPSWPQSYRLSMDMYTSVTPPTVSFLRGGSFMSSTDKKSQLSDTESLLIKPLISSTSQDTELVPTSSHPIKLSSASGLSLLSNELASAQQCSYTQTVLNAVNTMCGIGILSTPYALKEGGWFSLLLLIIFGSITFYTGILLKRCLESSARLQTYPDIGEAAFGLGGRLFIAIILYVELYSSAVEFLIMMSDNMSSFFPNAQVYIGGLHLDSFQICAITSTLVILPTVWLRNLSLLSYVSVGGVLTMILAVFCLLWVGTVDGIGFHLSGKAINFSNIPITVGIYSFCYGGHSVFPNIYSSMKEPSRFPSVLFFSGVGAYKLLASSKFLFVSCSFTLAGLFYAGVAICGFLMFGEATDSQFTLNLPTELIASKVAGWTVVVAPVTKFALTITPIALALEELLPANQLRSHSMSILIRTSLVISTLFVALAVPYFGSVMALIGSLLVMLMSVILPCTCYLRISRSNLTKVEIATCAFVISAGVFSAIVGTYSALTSMSKME